MVRDLEESDKVDLARVEMDKEELDRVASGRAPLDKDLDLEVLGLVRQR